MMRAVPPDDDPRSKMTDTDIVCGLRSNEPERRRMALEALCGVNGGVLIVNTVKENRVVATNRLNPAPMFMALIFVAQQLAKLCGVSLQWAPEPVDPNKLVVAQPDSLPPAP